MAEQDTNDRPVGNNELFSRELFIALEYLLKYSDKEHPAMASKIIKYAEENYGVKIDRRHLSTVLWTLYSNNKFNKLLGIKIDCKESQPNGNGDIRRKYYVASRSIETKDLAKIIAAIKAYSLLNEEDKKKLIDTLFDIHTNEYNKNKVLTEISIQGIDQDTSMLNKKTLKLYKRFVGHSLKLVEVKYYKLETTRINENGSHHVERVEKVKRCYVYSIKVIERTFVVYLLDLRNMKFIPLKSKDIVDVKFEDIKYEKGDIKGLDILKKYNSIEEYINEYKVVLGGKLVEVSFDVPEYEDIEAPFRRTYGQEIKRGKLIENRINGCRLRHYSYMCDDREAVLFLSDPKILGKVYHIKPDYIANRVAFRYTQLLRHCNNDEVTYEINKKDTYKSYKKEDDKDDLAR